MCSLLAFNVRNQLIFKIILCGLREIICGRDLSPGWPICKLWYSAGLVESALSLSVMMVTCDGSSNCMLSVQSASKEPEGTLKTVYLPKLLSQSCLICACDLQIFRVSSRQTWGKLQPCLFLMILESFKLCAIWLSCIDWEPMVGIPPLGVVVMAGREADSVHVCVCVCVYMCTCMGNVGVKGEGNILVWRTEPRG